MIVLFCLLLGTHAPAFSNELTIELDNFTAPSKPSTPSRSEQNAPIERNNWKAAGTLQGFSGQEKLLFGNSFSDWFDAKNSESLASETHQDQNEIPGEIGSTTLISPSVRIEPAATQGQPANISFDAKPASRFRVYFGDFHLTEFLTPSDAFLLVPSSTFSGVQISSGRPALDQENKDFYPVVRFKPCTAHSCFAPQWPGHMRSSIGLATDTSGLWQLNSSFGSKSRTEKAQSKPEITPLSSFWSVDTTKSAGRYQVTDDSNTLTDTSDDRTLTLERNGFSRLSFLHNSFYSLPQLTSILNLSLFHVNALQELASDRELFDEKGLNKKPVAFKKLTLAQIEAGHVSFQTGSRLKARSAVQNSDLYIPFSPYEQNTATAKTSSIQWAQSLQLSSPRLKITKSIAQARKIRIRQYSLQAEFQNSASKNSLVYQSGIRKEENISKNALALQSGLSLHLSSYKENLFYLSLNYSTFTLTTQYESSCKGFPQYFCARNTATEGLQLPQAEATLGIENPNFTASVFAGFQSRFPDVSERYGNLAGVKANPNLKSERSNSIGTTLEFSVLRFDYRLSHDHDLIVPQSGNGPFTVFVNQTEAHTHQLTLGLAPQFNSGFTTRVRYDFIRAYAVAAPQTQLPRTPKHTLYLEVRSKDIKVTDLLQNNVFIFSGVSSNWQSNYFLDQKNLIEFEPKIVLAPFLGVLLNPVGETEAKRRIVCLLQGTFSVPETSRQRDRLGNTYTVAHNGVEGSSSQRPVISLIFKGEF